MKKFILLVISVVAFTSLNAKEENHDGGDKDFSMSFQQGPIQKNPNMKKSTKQEKQKENEIIITKSFKK